MSPTYDLPSARLEAEFRHSRLSEQEGTEHSRDVCATPLDNESVSDFHPIDGEPFPDDPVDALGRKTSFAWRPTLALLPRLFPDVGPLRTPVRQKHQLINDSLCQ